MNKLIQDVEYGKKAENTTLQTIRDYFNDDDITLIDYTFNQYDFKSIKSNTIYELKSRRNDYNKYPTTMIARDKINDEYNNIFLFNFNNTELYYIKYDKDLFKKFEVKPFRRTDRGFDILKEYVYIPIEFLTKIM